MHITFFYLIIYIFILYHYVFFLLIFTSPRPSYRHHSSVFSPSPGGQVSGLPRSRSDDMHPALDFLLEFSDTI